MSLIDCKECGKKISRDAKACPNCGAEMPKRTSAITWVVALFFVATIGTMISANNDAQETAQKQAVIEQKRIAQLTPDQRAAEEKLKAQAAAKKLEADDLDTARSACEDFVKKTLHDPDSAQFEDFRTYWAKLEKKDIYHVQVRVSAKNGFGALRKIAVDCRVAKAKGEWFAVRIKQI